MTSLIEQITGVSDVNTSIASSDREFYPEYSLAGFQQYSEGSNYSHDSLGFSTGHLANSDIYYSPLGEFSCPSCAMSRNVVSFTESYGNFQPRFQFANFA